MRYKPERNPGGIALTKHLIYVNENNTMRRQRKVLVINISCKLVLFLDLYINFMFTITLNLYLSY